MGTQRRGWRWLWLALAIAAAGLLALPVFGQAGPGPGDLARTPLPPDPPPIAATATPYPLMRPDRETLERWISLHNAAPEAYIPPEIKSGRKQLAAGSFSLLPLLSYVPSERNQGGCGDCWQWAGTGVVEIALNVQEGIRDRLSLQHVSSCYNGGSNDGCVCCGGWMSMLADFYEQQGYALPWSNSNAAWSDGGRWCGDNGACSAAAVSCGGISTWPRYTIGQCNVLSIPTEGIGQAQAIANIKAVLHQNKAIFFAFFLPDSQEWSKFGNFWSSQPESAVFNPNSACGKPWGSGGAGHAVLCVGYDDTDPNNPYWIMLNSWGASPNRPNGLFRMSMNMDYNCLVGSFRAFYWETLDISFDAVTPTPTVEPECSSYYTAYCNWSDHWYTNGYPQTLDFYSCSEWYESGSEYIYDFTPQQTGWVTAGLADLSADLDLFVLDGATRCNAADCLAYGNTDVTFWANAGHRYYLVVDGYHGAASSYTLNISCEASVTTTPTPTRTRTRTPTPTRTGSPPARWVWTSEAEAGARYTPMGLGSDANASDCGYVYSSESGSGAVTFTFDLPAAMWCYPWARAMGLSYTQNSFYYAFDGGDEYHYEIPQVGGQWAWGWNRVYPADGATTAYWLTAGAHTLRIRAREPFARLDAVGLTNDGAYSIAAFTPCGGATPTPTRTLTPTSEPPLYLSEFEAEDGLVLPLFSAAPDQAASSCSYVYTVENSLGSASFQFYVPYAGAHYLWARSMGLSYTQNSFYVSFDGGVEFHYEIPQYNNQWTWHWNRVYPVDTTPAPVYLAQGWHTVSFRGRETYARLDAICVVNRASYTPTTVNPCYITHTPSPTIVLTRTVTPGPYPYPISGGLWLPLLRKR